MSQTAEPVAFAATQWFVNGDHPKDYASDQPGLEGGELRNFSGAERKAKNWEGEVVRYYRHPSVSGDAVCASCGKVMHFHGWIDKGNDGLTVCPGDYIVTTPSGEHHAVKPAVMAAFERGDADLPFPLN